MDGSAVRVEAVALTRLHPAPWNPRQIKDVRFENLCRSIEADPEFLWRRPVLAQADGTIYAGNMRYRAAQHLALASIPAMIEDVPDQLAKERAVRDNSQWGEWVEDDLAALLDGLRVDGADLDLLGFGERELQQLLDRFAKGGGLTDPDEIPVLPEEPVTKPGDLWLLGEHRVLCGDATDQHDLTIVMDGAHADMVFTDPPYGVEIVSRTGTTGVANVTARTKKHGARTILNDDLCLPELTAFLGKAFAHALSATRPGAAWYVCGPHNAIGLAFSLALNELDVWKHSLVWVKSSLVLSRADYHYRHELIYYGWSPGAAHRAVLDRTQDTVWEFDRPHASPEHPTMKPVALVERALANSSVAGEVVLDQFLGAGSTLIACERLGRRCYGIDIEPRFVDVAVRRWERFTGRTAERQGTDSLRTAEAKLATMELGKINL